MLNPKVEAQISQVPAGPELKLKARRGSRLKNSGLFQRQLLRFSHAHGRNRPHLLKRLTG